MIMKGMKAQADTGRETRHRERRCNRLQRRSGQDGDLDHQSDHCQSAVFGDIERRHGNE